MNSILGLRFLLVICMINALLLINLQKITLASLSSSKNDQRSTSSESNSGSSSSAATNNNKKNVAIHKEVKNVNVNNEENTNISMQEKNKFNSQLAQIVINMPKQKVLRKSRRPTDEEKKLWFKIKALYEQSRQKPDSDAFRHLGIVIDGLNPKYIATYRLWKILNSDSISPYVPAEPLPNPLGSVEKQEFSADKPIPGQLAELSAKLKELVVWDLEGMQKLANTPDRELIPVELVVKKALLCASNQHLCPKIDTIHDEASKKLDARGVLAAIGHDPTKKRDKPNLEKLIEEATNGDSDDDEIEDPDEPDPSSMFPGQENQDDEEEEGEEEDGELKAPDAPAAPEPPLKRISRKANTKSRGKYRQKSDGENSHHRSRNSNNKRHTKKSVAPSEAPKPKSIADNHVDHDSPLSPESLMRLNRMRNSERFKSKLQFIRGESR